MLYTVVGPTVKVEEPDFWEKQQVSRTCYPNQVSDNPVAVIYWNWESPLPNIYKIVEVGVEKPFSWDLRLMFVVYIMWKKKGIVCGKNPVWSIKNWPFWVTERLRIYCLVTNATKIVNNRVIKMFIYNNKYFYVGFWIPYLLYTHIY